MKTSRFSWVTPKAVRRPSGIGGTGLFARRPIKKGETVAVSGGKIFSEEELNKLEARYPGSEEYAVTVAPGFYVAVPGYGREFEKLDSFNHSCNPNCGFGPGAALIWVAMRDIAVGEELTYDYAMSDAEEWELPTPCECGAPNCRHTITGNDWRIPELQKRYNGYFSSYVQACIDGKYQP